MTEIDWIFVGWLTLGNVIGNIIVKYSLGWIENFYAEQHALREEIELLNADIAERESQKIGYKLTKRCKNCSCE